MSGLWRAQTGELCLKALARASGRTSISCGTALIVPTVPLTQRILDTLRHPHPSKAPHPCSFLFASYFFLPFFSHGNAVRATPFSQEPMAPLPCGSLHRSSSALALGTGKRGLWTKWCGLATRDGPHSSSLLIRSKKLGRSAMLVTIALCWKQADAR